MCGYLQGKWPVRARQCADHVRATGGKNIVNSVGRCDDAFASRDSRVASEPAYDITGFLIVEILECKLASELVTKTIEEHVLTMGEVEWR